MTGIIITVALVIHRDDSDGLQPDSVYQGYTTGIHWAYPVIMVGAALLIAAGLSATDLVQRRRHDGDPVTRQEEGEANSG